MYSGRVVSKSLLKRSLPILSHNGRGQNNHHNNNNNNNYSNSPHTAVNMPHPQGPPAPMIHPHQTGYNNLPKYSNKVSKKLQQFPQHHHMIAPPPLMNIGNFLPQPVLPNPSTANIVNAPPVIFQHKAVSHALPGRVMRIDEWHPSYRDNGVLVEYLQAHERHLGILDKPLDATHWTILTAAPTHCSLRGKRAASEEVPRASVPCREVTFQWPQHHMNTLYRYRVEDLPELLHMCQELVEKYRDQVQIAWGAHIDHHPRDYHKHHYHHALLANFLFGQVPKPHEYYIAQRLLVESTRYFTPTADPLYFSVNSPQHVQNFNKPRVSEVTEPAPNDKNVEPETAEVSRDSARLDDVEGTRQFVRRLVKRLQHKYPRARDHDAQRARDQSVVVSEEWNPVADKALIDELKTWALNNSSVNERLISAENSRPVRHTTMMVHERLIEPLCRGLGIGTTPRDIFDVLTSLGVWHKHENLNLHRYPYKWQFSAQELLHYAHLSTLFGPSVTRDSSASQVCVDKDHAVRVDMRQQCPVVVSVDNSTEQLEVDDAVSLEHVTGTDRPWIWVHIADPSRCVTPNSAVDLLARERVSSIYLPERARDPITMFPAPLVSSNFNLLHDHTNYALSFGIRLQEDGQVDEYVIVPSIVPPVHKRTYALVDDWLHEDWVPRDSEQNMLHELYALSQRRRAYRTRCGALASMELPRAEISVRENGEQIEISMVPEHDSKSRALISELMILVGDITADFAKRHDIPIPYRSPVPDQPSKYTYCVRPPTTPHSALALPLYTQVTSPIRRYHDLLVHHQIKAHLRGEELPFTEERVAAILHEMEPVLREITKLNQYSTRYWMLRYLEQQPQHRKYIGRVLSINTAASDSEVSVYVYMLEVGLRANVMLDWRPKVHQHLTLCVNSVDAFYNLIHLSEVPSNCE